MKSHLKLIQIVVLAITLISCNSENESLYDGNHRFNPSGANQVYSFNLSLSSNYIEQSDDPLTRADANTYVGINVTRKKKSSANSDTEYYAYGVFTSTTSINIDLITGYTYDFEATILRDYTDTYFHNNSNGYFAPFEYSQVSNPSDAAQFPSNNTGKFIYNYGSNSTSLKGFLGELSSGSAYVTISDNSTIAKTALFMFPRVDRYYGIKSDIDPISLAQTSSTIDIELTYKCFGITIDASLIPENSYITVADTSDRSDNSIYSHIVFPEDLQLSQDSSKWQGIYSAYDLTKSNEITFSLLFTWVSELNETKKAQQYISVKPGYNKTLKVSIDGTPNDTYPGNVNLIEGSSSLGEDDVTQITIPI